MTTISLCICTMNRPEELERALRSVRSGSAQPLEIVVSDDGHSVATASIAARHGARYQRGPARGLGPNRNACVATAQGTHLAFIDDDVEVPLDFVATAQKIASNNVLTGWECNHGGEEEPRKVTPSNPNFLGFQEKAVTDELRAIVINATVFPATLFTRASFEEQSRYGYEELDMARQALALGYRIEYCDELWVHHYPSPVNRSDYSKVLIASRLYLTARAYRRYERNLPKAVAFGAVASAHQIASGLRGGQGVRATLRPLTLALGYARASKKAAGTGTTTAG